jgi:hypothetical protein
MYEKEIEILSGLGETKNERAVLNTAIALMRQAPELIQRLTAENERLRMERIDICRQQGVWFRKWEAAEAELKKVQDSLCAK